MSLPQPPGRPARPVQSRIIGDHRSIGDAPALGPVARMEPGSCPHRKRRIPRHDTPNRIPRAKVPVWLLVLVGAICVMLVGLLFRR